MVGYLTETCFDKISSILSMALYLIDTDQTLVDNAITSPELVL